MVNAYHAYGIDYSWINRPSGLYYKSFIIVIYDHNDIMIIIYDHDSGQYNKTINDDPG